MTAGVGGDGFAVALENEAGGEFVGDELIVGRSLERQAGWQELLDRGGPGGAMVAAGEVEGEGGRLLKPSRAEAEEVGATEAQELSGGFRVEAAMVESVERLVEELGCEAFGELMFCMGPLSPRRALRAGGKTQSHFVPPESPILFPPRHERKSNVATMVNRPHPSRTSPPNLDTLCPVLSGRPRGCG